MAVYYNEIDPFCVAWLRELIKAGLIADGEVDGRDIRDVRADDLRGFSQCHFFAGIGGWSYALRLAGWSDDRPVWTGSCPCQPFSQAGRREGGTDDRHLWPHWARLIGECRPVAVFGEQVESAIAHGWLDGVVDDLEREGYACGAASLPAASVGAFHIRQRVWFVADTGYSTRGRCDRGLAATACRAWAEENDQASRRSRNLGGLADPEHAERRTIHVNREDGRDRQDGGREEAHSELGTCGEVRELGHAESADGDVSVRQRGSQQASPALGRASGPDFWADAVWIPCRDGKWRPTQPEIFPLASGISNRVGLLRGAGNSIVPQVAAAFIQAYMDARADAGGSLR